jgi:hypothetical protein
VQDQVSHREFQLRLTLVNVGNWLSLGQLIAAVLGFGLAFWQLSRTANAVERTERRLQANELLYALPQLYRLEQDLDEAVRAPNPSVETTIRMLNEWRRQSATVIAFIGSAGGNDDLQAELQNSVALAGAAKNALVNGKTNPLAVTNQVRASIEKVCRDIPQVAAELRSKIGKDDDDADS